MDEEVGEVDSVASRVVVYSGRLHESRDFFVVYLNNSIGSYI